MSKRKPLLGPPGSATSFLSSPRVRKQYFSHGDTLYTPETELSWGNIYPCCGRCSPFSLSLSPFPFLSFNCWSPTAFISPFLSLISCILQFENRKTKPSANITQRGFPEEEPRALKVRAEEQVGGPCALWVEGWGEGVRKALARL